MKGKLLTEEAYKALFLKARASLKESGGVIDRSHSVITLQNESITVLAKKSGNELVLTTEKCYTIKPNNNEGVPLVNFNEDDGGSQSMVPFLFVQGELVPDDQDRLLRIFHSILEEEKERLSK